MLSRHSATNFATQPCEHKACLCCPLHRRIPDNCKCEDFMDCKGKNYIHKELPQHRISQGSMASPGFDSHGISKTRSWVAHGRKNKNSHCTESFQVAWPLYVVCSGASHDTSTKNSPRNRKMFPHPSRARYVHTSRTSRTHHARTWPCFI